MTWRTVLCVVGALALGQAPAPAQDSPGLSGRSVLVRVFTGDRYDPKNDVSISARTRSIREDQAWFRDPAKRGKGNAADIVEIEAQEGYSESNLVTMQAAGLAHYLPANVPTRLCYCAGHVLVMAGSRVRSGPVPPVALNATVFAEVLRRFGTLRKSGSAEVGDVVAYYYSSDAPPLAPNHVAWVCEGGFSPKVITKEETERIYVVGIADVNAKKYKLRRVWIVPWERLRIQVVAGPIEIVGTPTVTPAEPMVGDTVTVSLDYRVLNPPSAGMEMQLDATVVDARGSVAAAPQRKMQPLTPGAPVRGQPPTLVGKTSFVTRVTRPGTHAWMLELSAVKPTSLDEAPAEYESICKTLSLTVRARPEVANLTLEAEPNRIPEGGQGVIQVGYTIKGVPEPGRPPLRVIAQAEQTGPGADPGTPVTKPLGRAEWLLSGPCPEIVVRRQVRINRAGAPGARTFRITFRVEADGLSPTEVTKECTYEVVSRE